MTEEKLMTEISEIKKDENLSFDEKKTYLSIYTAELEKQRADKYITSQKEKIQKIRTKVIDDIINIYPKLDEEKKEIADNMLYGLAYSSTTIDAFNVNDVVAEHELVSDSLTGTVAFYLDENIHKELSELNQMNRNFHRSIDRKFVKLEDKLSDIIDPQLFNFVDEETGEYKSQKEFDDIFVKENEKVEKLDIGAKEKGILKRILLETTKYGKSYGTMYEQFDNMQEYVEKKKSEVLDEMHM